MISIIAIVLCLVGVVMLIGGVISSVRERSFAWGGFLGGLDFIAGGWAMWMGPFLAGSLAERVSMRTRQPL
jgi:uncharacterized membrane protein